jgi:NADPH2:quinone reductase
MKAIEISRPGGPEVLRLVERPEPTLRPGELLIEVAASGLNRPDLSQRAGRYPPPPGASDLPGLEVAGRIVAGDADELAAARLRLGDRVCALTNGGGYAERCAVPIGQVLPVPAGLSDVEAASLPETSFTVWINVFERARLQPGETLLVQGGSSGIGVTAIQLAKALGSTVLVTVGDERKADACRRLGAHHAIVYKTHDFVEEVLRLTAGRGADVILDLVAGSYVGRELKCLADDGRLTIIGLQGGSAAEIDVGELVRRRLTITGSSLRPRSAAYKARVAAALRERVWPLLASGRVRPCIHKTFPAGEVVQAHAEMEAAQHIGKLVLVW